MSSSDKLVSAKEKIVAVRFLENLLEEYGNLEKIAQTLNEFVIKNFPLDDKRKEKGVFSVADLSRYTNRKALPTDERKNYLMSFILTKYNPASLIVKGIVGKGEFIDTSSLVSDICLLEKISFIVARRKLFKESFDKIVTCSIGGISFAITLSCELEIPLVNICYQHPFDLDHFYKREIPGSVKGQPEYLYLQKNMVKKGDKILLVDDIIRSGNTHQLIINLFDDIGCTIPIVLSLMSIGEDFHLHSKNGDPVLYILHTI